MLTRQGISTLLIEGESGHHEVDLVVWQTGFWRGTDRCLEVKEQFASHTFEDTSDMVGSEDPEMRGLPPALTKDGVAVMIALPREDRQKSTVEHVEHHRRTYRGTRV